MIRVIDKHKMLANGAPSRFLAWLCIGLCLVTGNVLGESVAGTELEALHKQYSDQFRSYLETSEHEQIRVASAVRLLRSNDSKAIERSTRLINEVLGTSTPDPASLWLIAEDCRWRQSADWCGVGGVYEKLIQADTDNAAVLTLEFSHNSPANDEELLDTEANRQWLMKMAKAKRYDAYVWRGGDKLYEEALVFVETHPPPPLPLETSPDMSLHAIAHLLVMGEMAVSSLSMSLSWSFSYGEIIRLCKIQVSNQHTETIKACKKIAMIMRESGASFLARRVGYGIGKAMLEAEKPDKPEIQSLELQNQTESLIQMCFSQLWVNHIDKWSAVDESTMMIFFKNMDERGERDGYRVSAIQDYKANPERFIINPSECVELLGWKEKKLEKLMDGEPGHLVWKRMLTEAKSKKSN